MKLVKVLTLVPETEHFDPELATVNEGIYLTEGHLQNIEDALAGNESVSEMVTEKDNQVTQLQGEVEALESNVATKEARIQELEQQVESLGKEPSGTGSTLTTSEDPNSDPKPIPSYADDNHPLNKWVDEEMAYRRSVGA